LFPLRHRGVTRDLECERSARELAGEFVAHVRGIEEISYGRIAPNIPAAARTRTGILLELETAAMGASAALLTRSDSCGGRERMTPGPEPIDRLAFGA
jgi:hypothetical protein